MRVGLIEGLIAVTGVVGLGLAFNVGDEHWTGAAGVCAISIAFALALSKSRLRRPMPSGVPDFLTVFLVFQVLNKVLTLISLAAGDSQLAPWEAAQLVEPVYLLRAEWVHLGAMILFTLGWLIVERIAPGRAPGPRPERQSIRFLIVFYLIAVLAALVFQRLSMVLSFGLMSTFMQFSALAAVGALLASKSDWGLGGSRTVLTALMLAPPLYLALTSGTKGAIVVVALPLLMAGLAKGVRPVLVVTVALSAFMLAVGIPLSQEMRRANWESYGAREDIGIGEGLSRVWDRYAEEGLPTVLGRTTIKFAHRASSAQTGGLVMKIAEQDGLLGPEPLELLPAIFIPRVLWPEKPIFQPGAWFSWYLGYATSPESATTATATMLGTEIYWMFGSVGLILVALLGAIYAATWRALATLSRRGLMGVAGMYALLGSAVRFEETHAVYAIASPIITLAYAYVLVSAERALRSFAATAVNRP